jgi:hypothetical protein
MRYTPVVRYNLRLSNGAVCSAGTPVKVERIQGPGIPVVVRVQTDSLVRPSVSSIYKFSTADGFEFYGTMDMVSFE